MPSLYYSLWVYTISDPPAGSPRLHNNEFLPNSSQTTNTEHSITAPGWIFLFLALVFIARQVYRMLILSNGQTKVWATLQCRPLRRGERIRWTCKMSHFYVLFSGGELCHKTTYAIKMGHSKVIHMFFLCYRQNFKNKLQIDKAKLSYMTSTTV